MLEVSGNVEIELGDGGRGRLVADGRRLVLDLDESSALAGVVGLRSLRRLSEGLSHVGLTLDVRSGDRSLLVAGRDARSGLVSSLLRLPRAHIGLRFAVRSAFARLRPGS